MTFETSVDIAAPAAVVWSIMSDVERWHEWTPSVRSIRRLDKGPLRLGSRALVRQPKLLPAVWTVEVLDPERSFTWKSGMPGLWVYGEHSVEPVATGTRAHLSVRFAGPLGLPLGRFLRSLNNRYLGLEAAGLKRRSEDASKNT
jgi:uncharacterized membrane protein